MSKLTEQLEQEAAAFGIEVEILEPYRDERGEITLTTPDGKRFDTDLHQLVNEQGDDMEKRRREAWGVVVKAAIDDVKVWGPKMEDCPADCGCRE